MVHLPQPLPSEQLAIHLRLSSKPIFFLFFLILISFPIGHALATTEATAQMFGSGEAGFEDDQIVLDNDSTVDLSYAVEEVTETTETIGGVEVDLTLEVEMGAAGDNVILTNTQLPTVEVQIPNGTKISAPANWNQQLAPPKSVTTPSIEIAGFNTPTTAIEVGSPNVILVFDKSVTIILEGTTGQTAYKLPGGIVWILISTCGGTFASPNDPPANGECSVTDGTDTKIVTFHFTQFTGLSTPAPSTPSTPSTGSGGSGNVGVGSPRIFGPGSSGGSSGGGEYRPPTQTGPIVFPAWFDNVKDWYRQGDISALEFLQAYQWLIDNL